MARWVLAVIACAGCWTSSRPAGPPIAESPAPRSIVPADTPARMTVARARAAPRLPADTVWEGTYYCSQGVTAVSFRLQIAGDVADAMFEFSATPDAAKPIPTGIAHLQGSITPTSEGGFFIDVAPFEWVEQPPGWYMVGVRATMSPDLAEMHGAMNDPACGAFDVKRTRR